MLLDIAFGILLSIFANWHFHLPLTPGLVFVCILLVLLLDIDSLLFLAFRGQNLDHRHRDILHYPIIFFLIGTLIYLFLNKDWGVVFLLAWAWHFLNDLSGIGWGIKLFWPFSKKYYKMPILPIHQAPGKARLPYRFLYVWNNEELEEVNKKYGDSNWIKNIYFKLNSILFIEIIALLLAVIIFIFYTIAA